METSSLGIDILNEGKLARIGPKGKKEPSRKSSQEVLLLIELKAKSKSPQANRPGALGEEEGLHGKLLPRSKHGIIPTSSWNRASPGRRHSMRRGVMR